MGIFKKLFGTPDTEKRIIQQKDVDNLVHTMKNDQDFDARINARISLEKIGWTPSTIENQVDWLIATNALTCKSLEKLGPSAVDQLIGYLEDDKLDSGGWRRYGAKRKDVRWETLMALRELKDPRSVPALVKTLREGKNKHRGMAAYALGRIATDEAGDVLASALYDDGDLDETGEYFHEVWTSVILALGLVHTPQALQALVECTRTLIDDEDRRDKKVKYAIMGLQNAGERALPELESLAEDCRLDSNLQDYARDAIANILEPETNHQIN